MRSASLTFSTRAWFAEAFGGKGKQCDARLRIEDRARIFRRGARDFGKFLGIRVRHDRAIGKEQRAGRPQVQSRALRNNHDEETGNQLRLRRKADRMQRRAHGFSSRVRRASHGPVGISGGHAQRREVQRAPRDVSRFVERRRRARGAARNKSGRRPRARARRGIHDRDVPQRHMQIRGDRVDDLFPAQQSDFREAFPRDGRRSGNDARVFALRQHDALKVRTRAGLEFLNQCHHTPKLSQVCAAVYLLGVSGRTISLQEHRLAFAFTL